jgi:hypothetical protein
VGYFYAIAMGQWPTGLPYLVKSSDATMQAAAAAEASAGEGDAAAQAKAADAWWDASADRSRVDRCAILRHAAQIYAKCDVKSLGLQQKLVERRLDDIRMILPHDEIMISAYIDGDSELHIVPTGIFWRETGKPAKPGKHGGHDDPTYVDNAPWMPKWKQPGSDGPDTSEIFKIPIGRPDYKFSVIAISESRDSTEIQKRTPVTMKTNNNEEVITIPDLEYEARWYTIKLYRGK